MSTKLDVENRNSAELLDKEANICPPSDSGELKMIGDSAPTEHCRVGADNDGANSDSRPVPNEADPAAVVGLEHDVDDSSNGNASFVDVDDIGTDLVDNDTDAAVDGAVVDEGGERKTVKRAQNVEMQDATMASPSDSGSAQPDSLSTNSCEGLISESCSSGHEMNTSESQPVVASESPTSTTESSAQSPADVLMPDERSADKDSLIGAAAAVDMSAGAGFQELDGVAPGDLSSTMPAVTDPEPSSSGSCGTGQSTYHIKWIKFQNASVPIITQNENGPCPLIAIMNVLLLQQKVKLPPMMEMITSSQLMDYLGDCILEHAPKDISEDAMLNYEQNMHDAMAVFHKLQTGLDVNVKFTGVSTFEYTSECIVFDLLGIPLYHGWLVDPENTSEVKAVGQCSYNQLVEKIIAQKSSPDEEKVREALIAEEFLNNTSHQLTYHGLSELASVLRDQQLCVFFRNNHFSTLYKHNNELFLLVTDQGFLTESNVVWETLSNVEGDGYFVDGSFRTYHKSEPSTRLPSLALEGSEQQINQDYLVALSLQQEQQQQQQPQYTNNDWQPTMSDHELALRLQEEENRRAAAALQRQQQQDEIDGTSSKPASSTSQHQKQQQQMPRGTSKDSNKKNSVECTIL